MYLSHYCSLVYSPSVACCMCSSTNMSIPKFFKNFSEKEVQELERARIIINRQQSTLIKDKSYRISVKGESNYLDTVYTGRILESLRCDICGSYVG